MFNQRDSVGLLTEPVQPSARRQPRTSVVLPAPRSPDSVTIMPPAKRAARGAHRPPRWRRHREKVASGAWTSASCDSTAQCVYACRAWRARHRAPDASRPTTRLDGARRGHPATGARARVPARSASPDTDLDVAEQRLARLARRGPARRDGLYGTARRAPRAPGALVPGTLRVITARMNYRPPAARASAAMLADPTKAFIARYALGRDYHKVLRGKLAAARRRASATAVGDFGYRVFTDSAPVLEVALAAKSGTRLAGQAHAAAHARGRLVVLPGRDLHRPAAAGRRAAVVALRQLQRVHRRLPDGRDRRALRARCAPLHLVPHDRASRQHSRGAASAHRQSRLRLRRLPALLPVEPVRAGRRRSRISPCATASTTPISSRCSRGPKPSSTRALRGSAIRRIGYERWSSNLAVGLGNAPTRPATSSPRSRRARTIRRRSCASMSPGRWRGTGGARASLMPAPRRIADQRISWFIATIGSITASTRTSTIAPMVDDQRRLQQRREPVDAARGLAFQLVGGALAASARAGRSPRRWP